MNKAIHAAFRRDLGRQLPWLAQGQRAGQVFLDGHRIAILIVRQIYNTEPAGGNLLYNAVSTDIQAIRQGSIVLGGHIFPYVMNFTPIVWKNRFFVKKRTEF